MRVLDVTDFTQLRPHDLRDRCCVVVGTIQTLRITNTEGRKVYAHNEHLEPHFAGIPEAAPDLERLADGPETAEKRAVGALWERESAGKCLFLMAEKTVAGKDVRGQLTEKAGA